MSLKKLANKVKKENKEQSRTVEELFTAALDDFIINRAKENDNPARKRKAHNPSGYYKCWRMKWYELLGFPIPEGKKKYYPKQQRVFDIGTATHEWVQNKILVEMAKNEKSPLKLIPIEELPVYGQEGIEFIREHGAADTEIKFLDKRFSNLFPISAMIDGALTFMGKNMLFEFKTINSKDFELLIEPSMDYKKQGALYSTCLGIKDVMFLYINKDTQEWRAFLVEYGKEHHDWVKERITQIEEFVENKQLPPKEVSDQCKWCSYKTLCDNDVSSIQ